MIHAGPGAGGRIMDWGEAQGREGRARGDEVGTPRTEDGTVTVTVTVTALGMGGHGAGPVKSV